MVCFSFISNVMFLVIFEESVRHLRKNDLLISLSGYSWYQENLSSELRFLYEYWNLKESGLVYPL